VLPWRPATTHTRGSFKGASVLAFLHGFFQRLKLKAKRHDPANPNNKQLPHPHLPKLRRTPQTPNKKQAPHPMQAVRVAEIASAEVARVTEVSRSLKELRKKFSEIDEAQHQILKPPSKPRRKRVNHNASRGNMQTCIKPIGKCPSKQNQQFTIAQAGEVKVFCLAGVPCWREPLNS